MWRKANWWAGTWRWPVVLSLATALVLAPVFTAMAQVMSSELTPQAITNVEWMWTSSTDSSGASLTVDDPTHYTLTLQDDGTFNVRADCNRMTGGYTLDGSTVSFSAGPTTLAECPPGSLYSQYLSDLGSVTDVSLDPDGNLILSSDTTGGTLLFTQASPASAQGK